MDGVICREMDATVILLTGGIGSGKSTVRRILEGLGVPCYDADSAVKAFYEVPAELAAAVSVVESGLGRPEPDTAEKPFLLPEIEKALGRSFRLPDGGFDSRALAGVIFSDASRLKTVEDIVFPALEEDFEAWRREAVSLMQSRRTVRTDESSEESPDISGGADRTGIPGSPTFLVFESATALDKPDFPKVWDKCLWVDAPEELRIERVTARDRCTREQVLSRLRLQSPLEAHRSEIDAVIFNDCPLPELSSRVRAALDQMYSSRVRAALRQI